MNMGKLLLLTLNEQEETAIDKIISAISDYIQIEPMQITTASVLSFHGCEPPFVGGFFQAAQAAKGGLGVATPTRFP
jgi:pyrroline-5-carboxylate reductase